MNMPQDIRVVRAYYVGGGAQAASKVGKVRSGYQVRRPPFNGYGTAVLVGEGKRITIFCPTTLSAYVVSQDATEIKDAPEVDISVEKLVDTILQRWHEAERLGLSANYKSAASVLTRLGAEVPERQVREEPKPKAEPREEPKAEPREEPKPKAEPRAEPEAKPRRSRDRLPADSLLRPVHPDKQMGRILRWVLDHPGETMDAIASACGTQINSTRAALVNLNSRHGIGLSYDGSRVTAVLPAGCVTPFTVDA